MNQQQTAAGTIFVYSWVLLLIGYLLPTPLQILAVIVAVLIAAGAMVLAVAIALDEAQHHIGD